MKRVIISLVVGFLLGSATIVGASNQVNAILANVKVNVNGTDKNLKNTPLMYNDRTYLPVREVSDLLGYEVVWDDQTSTVRLTQQYQDTDWIGISYLNEQYGVYMEVGKETTLSKGDVKITFPTPRSDAGIVDIVTDRGTFQINAYNGRFYIVLDQMKTIGLIQ